MRTYLNEGFKKMIKETNQKKGQTIKKLGPRTTVFSDSNQLMRKKVNISN